MLLQAEAIKTQNYAIGTSCKTPWLIARNLFYTSSYGASFLIYAYSKDRKIHPTVWIYRIFDSASDHSRNGELLQVFGLYDGCKYPYNSYKITINIVCMMYNIVRQLAGDNVNKT